MIVPLPDSAPLISRRPAWSKNTTETRTRLGNTAAIARSIPVWTARVGGVGVAGRVAGACAPAGTAASATASGSRRTRRVTRGILCQARGLPALHSRAADAAIAVRILGEVLLVVVLGVVERRRAGDLGGDWLEPARGEGGVVALARALGGLALPWRRREDRGPILGADVVPLPHALRRIVVLPKDLEQRLVAELRRVEHDEHDLGVPGAARTDFLIGRVLREAAGVADGRRVDAGRLPELPFRPPKAAEGEHGLLEARRKRRLERSAIHGVTVGHGHRGLAALEGRRLVWHRGLGGGEERHGIRNSP